MAHFLERIIKAFAPGAALKRAESRARLDALMQYEGASRSRRTKNWRTNSGDANATAWGARSRLRDVSRDLLRNNAWAARAQEVTISNVVGTGIRPVVLSEDEAAKAQAMALIEAHLMSTDLDADGKLDLVGFQELMTSASFADGEILLRFRARRAADGLAMPFQIQALEADHLDNSVDGPLANGNRAIEGVEFTRRGRRAAYHLYSSHPGDRNSFGERRTVRVPASEIAHVFRVARPGQVRGVPWLAPVMLKLKDLDEFEDAHLLRQKMAAMWVAFVQTDRTDDALKLSAEAEKEVEDLEPGMLEYLPPGKKVEFSDPPGPDGVDGYIAQQLRAIAAGIGCLTYEGLTGDFSQTNYSGARMGRIELMASAGRIQDRMIIGQGLATIGRWFTRTAPLAGLLSNDWRLTWAKPRPPMLDPAREVPAQVQAVEGDLKSRRQAMRDMGLDPAQMEAEMAEEGAPAGPPETP